MKDYLDDERLSAREFNRELYDRMIEYDTFGPFEAKALGDLGKRIAEPVTSVFKTEDRRQESEDRRREP